METDKDGFLRPRFSRELHPSEQFKLSRICPSVGQESLRRGRKLDPIWGPYVSAEIGFSNNKALRHRAASGGALSGFLISLIKSQQVDGVIHVTADPLNPLANVTTVSTSIRDIRGAAGSRYAPSSPLDILDSLRGGARRFAFVGKPCDVSALYALRQEDVEIARMVPILVSFFCAGVPSVQGGQDILRHMSVKPSDVAQFQHRAEGWPGRATATLKDGTQRSISYEESWGATLSKRVQHRCKLCADGSGVFADVVFADAWQSDAHGYPSFDDQPGQSLVLCRTQEGHSRVKAAQLSGHLDLSPYDLTALADVQPGQTRRRRVLLARLAALWLMGRPFPRYRGMGLWTMARRASVSDIVRNFGGMIRRASQRPVKEEGPC
ncbi:coenzyme F420 hydrogenase subunit beta [Litoreibacter meonggei]|uniref:Coenzyme F420 hydrogenase subunit beta n=2 Tax=Litoreibacter meonggei TaxID=1049199 RepID=A0A497VQY9_9RHOB|nr:coenzyme F420 hydrogenase subunit beta [Litoreibacter meonggei]